MLQQSLADIKERYMLQQSLADISEMQILILYPFMMYLQLQPILLPHSLLLYLSNKFITTINT